MDTLLLISAVEPSRSPIIAALEGQYEWIRRSPGTHPAEYQGMSLDGVILEISDGMPVVVAVRQLIRGDHLADIPICVVVDSSRVGLLQQTPEITDFIIKPFANDELRLRIARMISRARGGSRNACLEWQGLSLLLDERRVFLEGRPVPLTQREFSLLRHLLLHRNRVFSREQLLTAAWGFDYEGGGRTVDVHIRRIRTKLGMWGEMYVQTVHGIGYRLSEP